MRRLRSGNGARRRRCDGSHPARHAVHRRGCHSSTLGRCEGQCWQDAAWSCLHLVIERSDGGKRRRDGLNKCSPNWRCHHHGIGWLAAREQPRARDSAELQFNPGELAVPGVRGARSVESSEYIRKPKLIWRRLFAQAVRYALVLAALMVGTNNAARIPMMAITTSSSMSVKARFVISFHSICNRSQEAGRRRRWANRRSPNIS